MDAETSIERPGDEGTRFGVEKKKRLPTHDERLALVSCTRGPLHISPSNRRGWQGGPTKEYREYFEEVQRRQRRREPTRCATDFWYRTLELRHAGYDVVVVSQE